MREVRRKITNVEALGNGDLRVTLDVTTTIVRQETAQVVLSADDWSRVNSKGKRVARKQSTILAQLQRAVKGN